MSDQKLRDLERRWKETGTVEDEAAYLLERVRVGDLSQERLDLAAYCGHEGARRAVGGDDAMATAGSTEAIETWVRHWSEQQGNCAAGTDNLFFVLNLHRFGMPIVVRALLAAIRALGLVDDPSSEDLIGRVVNWCNCPCAAHGDDVDKANPRGQSFSALSATATLAAQAQFVATNPAETSRLAGSLRALTYFAIDAIARQSGTRAQPLLSSMTTALTAWSFGTDRTAAREASPGT